MIWDPYLVKEIDRLERVQRQAAIFIIQGIWVRLLQGGRGAGASQALSGLSDLTSEVKEASEPNALLTVATNIIQNQ